VVESEIRPDRIPESPPIGLLAAFAAFLYNIVRSVGVGGALSLFKPVRYDDGRLLPA